MATSTLHPSDSESYGSDDDEQTKSPIKEESGTEGDDESEDQQEDIVFVTQDQAVWSLEELEMLSPHKDEWVESSVTEQGAIVERAVKELLALRKQDPGPLRKKVRTWLWRKVKKRKIFGPGKAPSLHTVVSWYKDFELTKRVKEKHGVIPGDKMRFIGLWKTELTVMVNDLKNDPSRRKELKKMEDRRTRWTEKGPPPDKRKWAAEKKAMEMVKNFAYDIYWETGARIVVTIAYRNTKNTVCVGQFDWNKYLGRNGQSFVDEHEMEAQSFVDKFTEYAESHMSGNEADDVQNDTKANPRPKLTTMKPDLAFTRNSKREALLPEDCLDLKLEDKKHVFRCFLKSQYGLAKGALYPGSRCTPPWAKLAESPDRFFAPEDVPEIDDDGGRKKVILQDPSRMKNHELNACLRFWQDRQKEHEPSFQFHHWWSEGQKEFIQAHAADPLNSDADDDEKLLEHREKTGSRESKTQHRTGKKRAKKTNTKENSGTGVEMSKLNAKESGAKKEWKKKLDKKIDCSPNISEGKGEASGHSLPENARNRLETELRTPEVNGEDQLQDNVLSSHEPTVAPKTIFSPPTAVPPPAFSIPIDPALSGFPTQGPNDHVPHGFHAMPYSMIQSLVMNDRMPGPPNPQLPSGGHFTMETLATMMLSIDKRLRLQENQNNIVNQETIYPTTYIRGNGPSTPEEQLTTNSVAKVWPDQPVESQGVDGDTNEPASAIDTKNIPTRGRKRKVEEVEPNTAKKRSRKLVKIPEEDGPSRTSKVVRPRPATRGARKEQLDLDDHFRVLRSRHKPI